MRNSPTLTNASRVFIAVLVGLSLSTEGQSPSPPIYSRVSESMLPPNVVISLSEVNRLFPEVTHEASTGQNLTAVGNPKATRSVIYTNSEPAMRFSRAPSVKPEHGSRDSRVIAA
jgi:hypothetical protein